MNGIKTGHYSSGFPTAGGPGTRLIRRVTLIQNTLSGSDSRSGYELLQGKLSVKRICEQTWL
jgi:hypothetical protein